MKWNKYLFIAIASFGLFACNNDNNDSTTVEGKKAISLNIKQPGSSRAEQPPTPGENSSTLDVTVSHIFVKLVGTEITKTFESVAEANKHTFYDVPTSCTGVEVIINNSSLTESTATTETGKGTDVACYGKQEGLTPAGQTTKPEEKLQYDLYTITVQVKPVVARIEASNIQLVQEDGSQATPESTKYATLKLAGIFLNDYNENGTFANNVVTPSNPQLITSDAPATVLAAARALSMSDFFTEGEEISFIANKFPQSEEKCYAYNFFASTPKITLAFVDATLKPAQGGTCAPTRFAVVDKYMNALGETITDFSPGSIYRITTLNVKDKNITGDITGSTLIAVEATIEVLPWNIVDTTVEWK